MRFLRRKTKVSDNPFLTLPQCDPLRDGWREVYFIADFLSLGPVGRMIVIASLIAAAIVSGFVPTIDHQAKYLTLENFAAISISLAVSVCSIYGFLCASVEIRRRWVAKRRWPIFLYCLVFAVLIVIGAPKKKGGDHMLLHFFTASFLLGGPVYGAWRFLFPPARMLWRRARRWLQMRRLPA